MADVAGVVETRVGFAGGKGSLPATYETVSAGDGNSEAVRLWYDPSRTSYATLLGHFFAGHQPRSPVRTKARSVILYHDETQRVEAEEALAARETEEGRSLPVSIEPMAGTAWYDAEEWQQGYLAKEEAAKAKAAAEAEGPQP